MTKRRLTLELEKKTGNQEKIPIRGHSMNRKSFHTPKEDCPISLRFLRFITLKSFLIFPAILLLGLFISVTAQASDLDLSDARKLASAVEQASHQAQTATVVTVVDSGAHVILVERMPGAQLASLDISARKAASAVLYKRPTRLFEQGLAGGRTAILALPNAMPAAGGIPIMRGNTLIGAIGVSGGTNAQDDAVAQSAVDSFMHGQTTP